jgi:hypothetical protein
MRSGSRAGYGRLPELSQTARSRVDGIRAINSCEHHREEHMKRRLFESVMPLCAGFLAFGVLDCYA